MGMAPVIRDVLEEVFGKLCSEVRAQAGNISLQGSHRRFMVCRMGSTGSTWLAKLLNSHRDVFCYHEGVLGRIFPATSYGSQEIASFIRLLAEDTMHDAYKAAGDVGSIWLTHLAPLRQQSFTTALLVRHPAKMLYTRLQVWQRDKSFTPIQPEFSKCIERIWGIQASQYDELDQVFLQDAFIFATQTAEIENIDLCIRIEDMRNIDYCSSVLERLTGVQYEQSLVENSMHHPVNPRSGCGQHMPIHEIVRTFSSRQRDWYRLMLGEIAPLFGYNLESDQILLSVST